VRHRVLLRAEVGDRARADSLQLAEYREWANRAHAHHPGGVGKFNWTLQTYFPLRSASVPPRSHDASLRHRRLSSTLCAVGLAARHDGG